MRNEWVVFVLCKLNFNKVTTFQYVCCNVIAKIEEEKKTAETVKEKVETTDSTMQDEKEDKKSPSKRDHHSRKDHSLKIKLPSPEKRKRRLRESRDETSEVTKIIEG